MCLYGKIWNKFSVFLVYIQPDTCRTNWNFVQIFFYMPLRDKQGGHFEYVLHVFIQTHLDQIRYGFTISSACIFRIHP